MNIKKIYDKSLFTINSDIGSISFISLFFPIFFETAISTVLGTVNTALISNCSENAAAAIGASTPLISMLSLAGSVLSLGSSVVISNSIGAKKINYAEQICFAGLIVNIICTLIVLPFALLFAPNIMNFQNLSGDIFVMATSYFRIRCIFLPIYVVFTFLLAVLRCYGHSKYTFQVGLLCNILNLIFSIAIINIRGISPIDACSYMAYACGVSYLLALVFTIIAFRKCKMRIRIISQINEFIECTKKIISIGIPSAISSMSFTLSQIVTTSFVARLGDYALSGKVFCTNILNYVYLFSYSAGSTNSLLIGMRYGAGEYKEMNDMNKQLTRITMSANLFLSLVVIVFRQQLIGIFTDSELIISLTLGVFLFDIFCEQGRAVSQVYEYALRAIGDVWITLIALLASCWIFGIGLSYLCAIHFELGIVGCWIGLAADECFRAAFTYFRWKAVTKQLLNSKI